MMPKPEVLVISADQDQGRQLQARLEELHYRAAVLASSQGLAAHLARQACRVAILDLDTVAVDNQTFRMLRKSYPGLHILAMSRRPYHPELEEAMSTHIYACLAKPLDFEELAYWLKTISESLNEPNSNSGNQKVAPQEDIHE